MDVGALVKGWLGLIKPGTAGVGLRSSADFIQPVIDVGAMLGCDSRVFNVDANRSPVNAGETVLWTVPTGTTWRILAGSLSLANAAASAINQFGLIARPSEASTGPFGLFLTGPSRPQLAAAADNGHVLVEYPGLILLSGTVITLSASGVTVAAGLTANARLLVEELRG
jgi:hypothetical protein